MNMSKKQLIVWLYVLVAAACNGKPNFEQNQKENISVKAVNKGLAEFHIGMSPIRVQVLIHFPPLPPADPAAYPRYEPTHFEAVKTSSYPHEQKN